MSDLISRKAAKEKFDDIPPFIGMTGGCVQQMLDNVPASDAVELPCPVGKTVYVIDKGIPVRFEVNHFEIHRNTGVWAVLYDSVVATTRRITLNIKAFGKTVFFTREEAEKKAGISEVPKRCELCSEWNAATGWCKKHSVYTAQWSNCNIGGDK